MADIQIIINFGQLSSIGNALYAIGGKWELRIIIGLVRGKSRFNQLQRTIRGISSKVLTSELKKLEFHGFIKRHVQTQAPAVIEYELTEYAVSVQPVLDALAQWGSMHKKNTQVMKQEFDGR